MLEQGLVRYRQAGVVAELKRCIGDEKTYSILANPGSSLLLVGSFYPSKNTMFRLQP